MEIISELNTVWGLQYKEFKSIKSLEINKELKIWNNKIELCNTNNLSLGRM